MANRSGLPLKPNERMADGLPDGSRLRAPPCVSSTRLLLSLSLPSFLVPLLLFRIPLLSLVGGAKGDDVDEPGTRNCYCIVGGGPAGVQMAYLLDRAGRDYVVFEKSLAAGSFFERYPRHRILLSLNKRYLRRVIHPAFAPSRLRTSEGTQGRDSRHQMKESIIYAMTGTLSCWLGKIRRTTNS